MDDWVNGIYMKPFGAGVPMPHNYEASVPHRHDFYYCVLADHGELVLEVDFEKIHLSDYQVFFSYPGQIHSIKSANLNRGWFLAFDPAILNKHIKGIIDQRLPEVIVLGLNEQISTHLYSLLSHLYTLYKEPSQMFTKETTTSLIIAFMYELASHNLLTEQRNHGKHSARNIEITKEFKQLVREKFRTLRRPAQYADQMNLTATHINDSVKSVTGFSVTYYIQQEIIREAKRLLSYSELSVKEIAEELGFDDDKYFNRLFTKLVGTSPGAFRK